MGRLPTTRRLLRGLSAVSVPITVDSETRVSAALNIYSAHAHAFSTEDLHIAVRFASSAETTVLKHDECARMHGR